MVALGYKEGYNVNTVIMIRIMVTYMIGERRKQTPVRKKQLLSIHLKVRRFSPLCHALVQEIGVA